MRLLNFIHRQICEIQAGGPRVFARKIEVFSLCILAVPLVVAARLIRPWLLIRVGALIASRIGHFAANTEMYIYERYAGINAPKQRYIDLFYFSKPICNQQLAAMWRRVLNIWPNWILVPLVNANRLIPGGAIHEVGQLGTQHDRDIYNLRDQFPPILKFTAAEEAQGKAGLKAMGMPKDGPFICLSVRDSAYLDAHIPQSTWSNHDYRDSDIQKYALAAEELANRGYFVIRMGAKVKERIKSNHPKIIDYACNGMRTDFMDIYLCAKCEFMISTGEGLVCVPQLFRRPIVAVNFQPLGYWYTYYSNLIGITKHHHLIENSRELSAKEIFSYGVGFSLSTQEYASQGVQLIENTPEEIRDVAIEMVERLKGTWQPLEEDEELQRRFWTIFPRNSVDTYLRRPLHNEICARFGADFLRKNREWLN